MGASLAIRRAPDQCDDRAAVHAHDQGYVQSLSALYDDLLEAKRRIEAFKAEERTWYARRGLFPPTVPIPALARRALLERVTHVKGRKPTAQLRIIAILLDGQPHPVSELERAQRGASRESARNVITRLRWRGFRIRTLKSNRHECAYQLEYGSDGL